jgi:glutamine amidotransferase-like uncharacterized protein
MAKPIMTIFTHHPQCELDCAYAMGTIFDKAFTVKMITIAELNSDTLADTAVLAFGGGIGDADDFDDIFTLGHKLLIHKYLRDGGKYLGICMGAYWAGSHYFDILGDTEVVQYITTPDSDITTEFATIANVEWRDELVNMYFYDGCAFQDYLDDAQIWATYQNGYPMAIQHNNVGVIGCHPEAKKWWHDDIGGYDKNNKRLLLEFAKAL